MLQVSGGGGGSLMRRAIWPPYRREKVAWRAEGRAASPGLEMASASGGGRCLFRAIAITNVARPIGQMAARISASHLRRRRRRRRGHISTPAGSALSSCLAAASRRHRAPLTPPGGHRKHELAAPRGPRASDAAEVRGAPLDRVQWLAILLSCRQFQYPAPARSALPRGRRAADKQAQLG